jgi:hypothetical protein
MRRSGFLRLAGLFGVLKNATKTQLYRFTGLNRCLATIATAAKIKSQVDGLPNIKNAGYGWLTPFLHRNPRSF